MSAPLPSPLDHPERDGQAPSMLVGEQPARRTQRENARGTGRDVPGKPTALTHLGDFTATPHMLLLAAYAAGVGAITAVVALGLLRLIGLATNLFYFGRVETEIVSVAGTPLGPFVVVVPVLGGLAVGLIARYGSERVRGHGMPETIEAVLIGGSKVQPRVAVLKPIASAIAIGSGGPFGAEGPIIMTGGAIGSVLAQLLKLTADERKTLLVAGAAAGMAATFNAPLASILLAVELLLFEYRPRSLVPVAAAAAVATVVRQPLLGTGPLFPAGFTAVHISALTDLTSLGLGVVAALLAAVLTSLVYGSEDVFHRLPVHWMWWPAIGGLIIGLGGLVEPRALGVGYATLRDLLSGQAGVGIIVGILVVKSLIWSLSLGSGTSGGVLAPLLLIGAALGALVSPVLPAVGPGFWPLVAMAAILAGAMRIPVTGIVFVLETTHQLDALLPMVIASAAAYAVSVLLLKRSILTEKVARRGYHLTREYTVDPLEVLFVREAMSTDLLTFDWDADLDDVIRAVLAAREEGVPIALRQRLYPVLRADGTLAGVVTRRDVRDVAPEHGDGGPRPRLLDLVRTDPVIAYSDETLRTVAYRMADRGLTRLPVLTRDGDHLVGLVSLAQLLEGRLRDLEEERDAERVLRLRLSHLTRGGRVRRDSEQTVVSD